VFLRAVGHQGFLRLVDASIAFLAVLASPAGAQPVRPTLDIATLRVEVTWAESEAEIRTARARLGNRAMVGPIRGRELGFAVLVKRGEEYVCRIVALKPEDVDD